jgi:hypothetical protein
MLRQPSPESQSMQQPMGALPRAQASNIPTSSASGSLDVSFSTFNSFSDPIQLTEQDTATPSSEDDASLSEDHRYWGGEDEEHARNAIGVSISGAQARLASPKTPAAEKVAALKDSSDYFILADSMRVSDPDAPDANVSETWVKISFKCLNLN